MVITWNTDFVASRDREGINQKYPLPASRLVDMTEPNKERFSKRLGPVQTPIVLAPPKHGGQVAL
ncbi:hypothetical protein GGQ17_001234 [Salinibacter ruber]|nr:hypothetical protein [Salinibacter ruber]